MKSVVYLLHYFCGSDCCDSLSGAVVFVLSWCRIIWSLLCCRRVLNDIACVVERAL